MSKADVIEVEGTVLEKLPNAMFKVERRSGSHQRKASDEFHPYSSRRQSNHRAVPV